MELAEIKIGKVALYLTTFLIIAPITIAISLLSLFSLQTADNKSPIVAQNLLEIPKFGAQVYAALPQQQALVYGTATASDARVEMVRQYLNGYNSPLEPYSNLIIAASDQYNFDYRLLVAIAQQESNLCKKVPADTYNCWGWGIHSRGTLGFPNYETAIQTVAQGLREDYFDKGYDTVEEIMEKYTPLSNGSWSFGVNQFINEME